MKEDGYHIISETDCAELHYQYADEKIWNKSNKEMFSLYL